MNQKTPDNTGHGGDVARLLQSLRPRDTRLAAAHSVAYSRAVGVMRWLLPLAVLLVLTVLVVFPMIQARKITSAITGAIPDLVVENLSLTGLDDKNQPYALTAVRALQENNAKSVIRLEKPQGDITLESGAWLAGKAKKGRYDQSAKSLWLGDGVQIFHDGGYQFTTSEAWVNLKDNTASGEQPVLIQGPFGEIRGQGFRVTDRGKTVVITGRAQARLHLQTKRPSDKPDGAQSGKPPVSSTKEKP